MEESVRSRQRGQGHIAKRVGKNNASMVVAELHLGHAAEACPSRRRHRRRSRARLVVDSYKGFKVGVLDATLAKLSRATFQTVGWLLLAVLYVFDNQVN